MGFLSHGEAKHIHALAFLDPLRQDLPTIRKPHGIVIVVLHGSELRKGDLLGWADAAFPLQLLTYVSQQQLAPGGMQIAQTDFSGLGVKLVFRVPASSAREHLPILDGCYNIGGSRLFN